VLAAIIIEAVVMGMMDVSEMRRLYRVNRADFWIAIAAILGVLAAGVLAGVVIGVGLSLGLLIYVSAIPHMPELGRRPGTQAFLDVDEYPDSETYPGLLVMRFDAGLFFATADALEDGIRERTQAADPPLNAVVLDFEGVNFIDSQGADEVGKIVDLANAAGAEIRLARVKAPVQQMLDRDGVLDRLGADKIYANVYQAVADLIPQDTESS
jgi:SulP family sulfate permease